MNELSPLGRLSSLYDTVCRMLGRLDFLPPLFGRLVIAAVFIPSGWGKLHSLPDVINYFTTLGIPFPEYQAPFVAGVELVCGLMVLFGFATRLASFMLINTMVVAIITAIWPEAEGIVDLFAKDEAVYMAILTHLIIVGGGTLSLDALLPRLVLTAPTGATAAPRTIRA